MRNVKGTQVIYNKHFPCLAPRSVTAKPLDRQLESIAFEIPDEVYANIIVLTLHLTS